MIDLIQSLHISWFHAQHLRMIETLSFPWLGNALHLHQAHSQFLRVHLKTLRNLHFQHKSSYGSSRAVYRGRIIKSFDDAVTLAIVSHYLGVDALSAFVIVNLLIGITDQFVKGVADSLNTVSTLNDIRLRDTSLSLKWLRAGSTSCNA
jgi:hypothetical protein